ncbi:hypothetical protein CA601_32675 [Paraburkholderia hospita]|nr:hypothetical protein CA601_32675 [Paraburkholderia hospita]
MRGVPDEKVFKAARHDSGSLASRTARALDEPTGRAARIRTALRHSIEACEHGFLLALEQARQIIRDLSAAVLASDVKRNAEVDDDKGCNGHSLPVRGVGSVVAPDGDPCTAEAAIQARPLQMAYWMANAQVCKITGIKPGASAATAFVARRFAAVHARVCPVVLDGCEA